MQEKRQEFDSEGLQRDHRGLSQLAQKGPWPLKQDLRSVKRKHGLLCIDISLPAGEVRNSGVEDKVHGQILRAEGLGNFIRVRFGGRLDAGILAEFLSRGVIFESGRSFTLLAVHRVSLETGTTVHDFAFHNPPQSASDRPFSCTKRRIVQKSGEIYCRATETFLAKEAVLQRR